MYFMHYFQTRIKSIIKEVDMESVLANCSASISELKKNPSSLIEQSEGRGSQ